jgi:hypothetical protein
MFVLFDFHSLAFLSQISNEGKDPSRELCEIMPVSGNRPKLKCSDCYRTSIALAETKCRLRIVVERIPTLSLHSW